MLVASNQDILEYVIEKILAKGRKVKTVEGTVKSHSGKATQCKYKTPTFSPMKLRI